MNKYLEAVLEKAYQNQVLYKTWFFLRSLKIELFGNNGFYLPSGILLATK